MSDQLVQLGTHAGDPIMVGNTKLTPFSQSIQLMVPGQPIGFVYNRPVSILATSPDGQEEVIQIIDVTRRIQVTLLGIAAAWAMLLMILNIIIYRRKSNG